MSKSGSLSSIPNSISCTSKKATKNIVSPSKSNSKPHDLPDHRRPATRPAHPPQVHRGSGDASAFGGLWRPAEGYGLSGPTARGPNLLGHQPAKAERDRFPENFEKKTASHPDHGLFRLRARRLRAGRGGLSTQALFLRAVPEGSIQSPPSPSGKLPSCRSC